MVLRPDVGLWGAEAGIWLATWGAIRELAARDIVADLTGGTKPMWVGMIMACLPADRSLEYVARHSVTGEMSGPYAVDYQHSAFGLIG